MAPKRKPIEWTEAHCRWARARLYRIAAEHAERGNDSAAEDVATRAQHGWMSERSYREALAASLTVRELSEPARIDREVRRVDAVATARLVREPERWGVKAANTSRKAYVAMMAARSGGGPRPVVASGREEGRKALRRQHLPPCQHQEDGRIIVTHQASAASYRARHRAEGLCEHCPKPATRGTRCESCAAKATARRARAHGRAPSPRAPICDVGMSGRFWSKVDKSGGPDACWPWTASTNQGYGVFWADGKLSRATHWALQLSGRDVPAGLYVLHRCDNPPCVNPAHLFVGSQADNVRDCAAKGRIVLPAPKSKAVP